ncbi:hypothetical protein BH09MYX1_BH09MYX1_26090 [soil metagenome]
MSHGDRVGGGAAATALFVIASKIQYADVDPVAGDDAEEKAGRDVQVADDELGDPERARETAGDRQRHRDERARAHEVEKDDDEDRAEAGQPDLEEVSFDGAVLGEPGDEVAGKPHLDRRKSRAIVDLGDDAFDRRARIPAALEVACDDGGSHDDDEHRAGRVLVVAVGEALLVLAHAEALLHLGGVDLRGLFGGVVERGVHLSSRPRLRGRSLRSARCRSSRRRAASRLRSAANRAAFGRSACEFRAAMRVGRARARSRRRSRR